MLLSVAIVWAYAALLTAAGAYKNRSPNTQFSCRVDRSGLIGGGSASGYFGGNIGYGGGENSYRLGAPGIGRNNGPGVAATSSFVASTGDYERSYGDLYSTTSRFGDVPWQSASSEVDGSGSFSYGLGTVAESTVKSSEGYVGSYIITNRQASREKQALDEVSPKHLDTQVNPAVWEISRHMVLKRRKDYDAFG